VQTHISQQQKVATMMDTQQILGEKRGERAVRVL
jgi:hypothetical protein